MNVPRLPLTHNPFWPEGKVGWLRVLLTLAAIAIALSFLIWSPFHFLSRARAAGTIAPDFRAATLDGQVIELSSFRGRPVLLNFFATDCPWSQAAVGNINVMLK